MLQNVSILLFLVAAGSAAAEPATLLDEAAAIVREQFYDAGMHGLDWAEVTAEHRARIAPGADRESVAAEANRMLGRLEASHTYLRTRDDPEWFQLAGVFLEGYPPLQEALTRAFGHADPVYSGIGVTLERTAAGTFVSGVLHGFPAETAGLLVGDRLVAVEGAPFHPIRSFAGREGLATAMTVERRPGETVDLTVTPVLLDGRTMFQDAMRASARILERFGARIGYIRAWSYAGQEYQNILVSEATNGRLAAADALVLDVRGGWGGASPGYLNFFVPKSVEATSIGRDGRPGRYASGWSRPVVLLVDDGSRSGKELLAYGFRALNKGPIVGETTAGEVLAGRINALSDGSLLYVAVADVQVDGQRLEGRGVDPDVVVEFDPAYAAGMDPQLDRAAAVAAELVRSRRKTGGR